MSQSLPLVLVPGLLCSARCPSGLFTGGVPPLEGGACPLPDELGAGGALAAAGCGAGPRETTSSI